MNLNLRSLLKLGLALALATGVLGVSRTAPVATAATWFVATTGHDSNSCTSAAAACKTITAAIGRAVPGDVINVSPGLYMENVNISWDLSLVGAGAATTIIDGGGIGPVVLITAETGSTTVSISGVTLQNGEFGLGGGIHSESGGGTLTVSNSAVVNNIAQTGGGGIFSQGNLVLNNVVLQGNQNDGSQRGGGLLSLGRANLINVTIASNTAPAGGGGIGNLGTLTVTNSFIGNGNSAGTGGGIYNYGSSAKVTLSGSTVSGNETTIAGGGGIYNEGGQLIVSGSTITGNQATGNGGGIYNGNLGVSVGVLTLSNSVLQNNSTGSSGGGLDNESTANIDTTVLIGNRAEVSGGGILNGLNGKLNFYNSTVRDNTAATAQGGGLRNQGNAVLSGVQLLNNTASSGSGGGIENSLNAKLTLNNSTLSHNRAQSSLGGGLHNYAAANLLQVRIEGNQANGGGGLYNEAAGALTLQTSVILSNTATAIGGGGINNQGAITITQSTLAYNSTTLVQGGGLFNLASATIINSTFSDNTAPAVSDSGGAIYNSAGTVQLTHVTLSHNRAPAVVNAAGTVGLANSIVSQSSGGSNCSGTITSSGNNIDSGTSCGFSGGSLNNTDPLLGPLHDNGGGTLTRIIFVSSPALDAASGAACLVLDQRGVARPQGNGCDIGAYEVIGYTNSTPGSITAGSCITSETNVNSSFIMGSLHVGVNLDYAPRGDLRLRLISPQNRSVNVLGDTGGTGANLDVLWDDDELTPVGTEDHDPAFPYYDYLRRPDSPLTTLFGISVRGLWKLEICNVGTGTGTLNRWTLVVPDVRNPKIALPILRR